jgi:aspartyl-tRNA(Asn)/glutamyl-tRNA(Gln) amidotransferase subunit A
VPLAGAVPLATTLDHAGPLAHSVMDAWTLYDVLRGRAGAGTAVTSRGVDGLKLGVLRRYFCDVLEEGVRARFEEALAALRSAGAIVVDAEIPHAALIAPAYLHVVLGEAAAYHASALEADASLYTEPVRLRLEMARYVRAEDYARAMLVRTVLVREVTSALRSLDALALPALAIAAPALGAPRVTIGGIEHPVRNVMLRLTQLFNLTGHPAISLPCGNTTAGLPCGLQLAGHDGRTPALLSVALAVEQCLAQSGVCRSGGRGG